MNQHSKIWITLLFSLLLPRYTWKWSSLAAARRELSYCWCCLAVMQISSSWINPSTWLSAPSLCLMPHPLFIFPLLLLPVVFRPGRKCNSWSMPWFMDMDDAGKVLQMWSCKRLLPRVYCAPEHCSSRGVSLTAIRYVMEWRWPHVPVQLISYSS